MKTVYIPKGETVSYETLETDRLVVEGCLKVVYGIKARTISGGGMITASTVSADDSREDCTAYFTLLTKLQIKDTLTALDKVPDAEFYYQSIA